MPNVASGKALDGAQLAQLVAGSDGTNTVFLKVSSTGAVAIAGTGAADLGKAEDAAHTSGDTGVMLLGVRNDAAAATFSGTDGDYTPVAVDSKGRVQIIGATAVGTADGSSATAGFVPDSGGGNRSLTVYPYGFNGSTWDRTRNNNEATALASAARTASTASSDLTNYNGKLVVVVVNVTVWTADAITPAIQGKDPISGTYFQLHANFTAISATGTYVYVVGLSTLTAAAGGITAVAQAPIPRTWRVNMVHAGATTTTYSVAAITLH